MNVRPLPLRGFVPYAGIVNAIRDELQVEGGAKDLAGIIRIVTHRYGVAEASVRAYASAFPPFETKDGVVRMAQPGSTQTPRKTWRQSKRVYKLGDRFGLRIVVTRDHIRGSGSACPVGLAAAFEGGLTHGQSRQFHFGQIAVAVSWAGIQPFLGSVGPVVRELNAEEGDHVLLSFGVEGDLAISILNVEGVDPLESAVLLTGGNSVPAREAQFQQIALSIGVPSTSSVADIVASLESRGESDLAALVMNHGQDVVDAARISPRLILRELAISWTCCDWRPTDRSTRVRNIVALSKRSG